MIAPRRSSSRARSPAAERMRRYRARRREAGLRLERRWVADPRSGTRSPWSDHRVLDARSLAMHCLVARKIARHPTLLDRARENLSRWSTGVDGAPPRYLDEWRRILERPWPEIAALITGLDEQSFRLRQSSPFAGILSPAERRRIYEAFRA